MTERMLVTGALGVIGSSLLPYLRRQGYKVTGADLMVRDFSDYVRADITSFEDMYRVFKRDEPDILIHMAGEVGRMVGEEHPQKMIFVNNTGVLNLIKLCLDYDTRLVFFSTSEVYGHLFDKKKPVKEEDIETEGSSFITTNIYALSKLFGEAIVKHYVENYDLNAVTVRPFMIYGRGEYPSKYRSAITNFVNRALKGEQLSVHNGAVRAWCNINDFVEGVRLVAEHPFSGKYEAFNIGSDEYHTMEEVARIAVNEAGGTEEQIDIVEPPEKFLSLVKIASIDKARQIGYSPRVTLKEGIHSVAEWQRDEILGRRKL